MDKLIVIYNCDPICKSMHDAFWKSRFYISEFHVPKALFCSVAIKTISFACIPTVITENYMYSIIYDYNLFITYGYFNIRRWDQDHSTKNKMAIP